MLADIFLRATEGLEVPCYWRCDLAPRRALFAESEQEYFDQVLEFVSIFGYRAVDRDKTAETLRIIWERHYCHD